MKKNLVFILSSFILMTSQVNADLTRESMKQAVDYLNKKESKKAYEFLLKEHNPTSKNPQEWFLLGMAAKETGDLDNATAYFKKVIALDPAAVRVKLELAEIEFLQGNTNGATELLLETRSYNPPSQVSATIDRFIASLSEAKQKDQKKFRVWGTLGWLYDSNANAGPDSDAVTFFGLPFRLNSAATKNEDNAIQTRLGIDHITGINAKLGWQSNASLSWTDYNNLSNLDTLYISAGTGPAWKQNSKTLWSFPAIVDWVNIGQNESYFSYSYGFAPQIRYQANNRTTLGASTSVTHRRYDMNANRDLVAWAFSPLIDYTVDINTSIRLSGIALKEESGLRYFTNDTWGVDGNFYHNFTEDLLVNVHTGLSRSYFGGTEPAYTETRNDRVIRGGLNLIYNINNYDMDAIISFNRTKNISNLPIYHFDRDQIMLSFRKAVEF
jgi:outer membrane protein